MGKDTRKAGSANEPETESRTIPNPATRGKSRSTATESASNAGGRGRGRGTGTTEGEEKSPIVALVETKTLDEKEVEKKRKRAEAQKKRRIAAKEKKEGLTVNPKSKADPTQIKILLSTVSMLAASKEGMEQWVLSDAELDQIAKPLANILSKYEGISTISTEYADHMALALAAFTIIFPRVMMTLQNKKNKKPKEVKVHARNDKHGQSSIAQQQSNGETKPSSRSSDRESTPTAPNVGQELSNLLSPTVGF